MSQNESIILSVIHRKLPVSQVAKQYGGSRAWVYRLLDRQSERAGVIPYLGMAKSQIGKEVLLMVSPKDVIVTDKFTGEVLSEHWIEPTARYWQKKETPRKNPKRS